MIPWSETNTEAFAGLHNQGNSILLVFDEASAIDDRISLSLAPNAPSRHEPHFKQHFLYFLPLPHGHGSFRPILWESLWLRSALVFWSISESCFHG